ncbi:MAG TPA: hypothetical protein VLA95_01010 [Gemmatimonadales bacterium]|nr:hypothetical protein [Gemmatimonadales bacterium]
MRRLVRVLVLVPAVLAGCAKPDAAPPAADTTAAAMPAAPTVTLADFAGNWQVVARNEAGDSVTYQLAAGADPATWSITFPGRDPIPARVVEVAGDSVVVEGGPFESAMRPGVQVETRTVLRLQDGALVGQTVARYATTGPDSVANITARGTRLP